jgi:hypothetical protein
MAAVTGSVITEISPNPGLKQIAVILPATADPGDTVAINLSTYNIGTVYTVETVCHTTAFSVVVAEAATCAVSGTTLTVTLLAGTGNTDKRRVILVTGKS